MFFPSFRFWFTSLLQLVLLQALQQQEAALQVQVSHLTFQNLELRRELSSGWTVAEPHILQVRALGFIAYQT